MLSEEVKSAKGGKLKFLDLLRKGLSSRGYPFVTAAVLLACYYLSWDIVAIYYVAVSATLMLLLLDDLTPAIGLMPFMNVVISYKNSPSYTAGESGYYYQPVIFIQIIILVAIAVGAVIFRAIKLFAEHKFKPTPVFFGLCVLSVFFLLNGVFSEEYTIKNLMYGAIMAALYLGVFVVVKDNVKIKEDTFEKISLWFFAFSILLIVELVVSYFTYEGLFVDGSIERKVLMYGWGVYNTMGMLLLICLPSAAYLATRYKAGYLFTVYCFVLAAACVVSMSRQALVGAVVILPLSLAYVLCKRKNRIVNICIIGAFILGAVAAMIVMWDKLYSIFEDTFSIIVNGKIMDNGRFKLYKMGWADFIANPAFGVGFFSPSVASFLKNNTGLEFIPVFYHNTLVQMAASCGIFGIVAYLFHRIQTVVNYFRRPTIERSYVAVTILVLLLLSLLDVHMFSLFPNFIYSCFVGLLVASAKKPAQSELQKRLFIIKV